MKKNFRKLLVLFLTAVLLAAFLPAQLMADDDGDCRHVLGSEMQHMSSCRDPEADYYKCSACGEWVDPETGHIFLGHDFIQGDVAMRPTCEAAAYYEIVCTLCGYTEHHETEPALGHDWGEWTVAKAPTATENGIRIRTCKRQGCGVTEQQAIPADPSLAPENPSQGSAEVSLSSLEVYILQQMLTEEGLFSGTIDGVYGPATDAAVRTFQHNNGLSQTDPAMADTFRKLSDNFLTRHTFYEPGEYLASYDCGLTVDPMTERTAVSNGDGTHTVTVTRVGLTFEREGERKEIRTSDSFQSVLASYPDDCLLGNESHTCSECGFEGPTGFGYSLSVSDISPDDIGSWILISDPVLRDIPPISDLSWHPLEFTAVWSAYPGADSYEWVLYDYNYTLKQFTPHASGITANTYVNLSEELTDMEGLYQITVTAMAAGEHISLPGTFQFTESNQMFPVRDLKVENGFVSWKIDTDYALVLLIVNDGDSGKELGTKSVVGQACADVMDILEKSGCKTYRVTARVFSHNSPNGGRLPSEDVTSEIIKYKKPRYIRTTAAVNMRSGPGKEYARVGGVGSNELLRVIDEEDGFYKVFYSGTAGWVMASCTAPGKKETHQITLDPGNGTGTPATVETAPSGRITSWPSLDDWFCPGSTTYYFSREKNGSERVDDREVFTEDTTLYAVWERDKTLAYLTFIDENGETLDAFWVRKNADLHLFQYPDKGADSPANMGRCWYTEPDGKGERVDLKYYIVPADAPDSITLYASLAKQSELYIDDPALLYEEPDTSSHVLDELRNEKVKILDLTPDEKFYHVQKGGIHGYVLAASVAFRKFYVQFDPAGGWCDVKVAYASYWGFLPIPLPVPEKDGYSFAGWTDKNGTVYTDAMLKEGPLMTNLFLRAAWIAEDGYARQAIAVGSPSQGAGLYSEANSHEGYLETAIPSGSMVTVIGEKNGMYRAVTPGGTGWLKEEEVSFDYKTLSFTVYGQSSYGLYIRSGTGENAAGCNHWVKGYSTETFYVTGERSGYYRLAIALPDTDFKEAWVRKENFDEQRSQTECENISTVVFNACGGSMGGKKMITAALTGDGRVADFPIPVRSGYTFKGWFTDPAAGMLANGESQFDRNTNLFAHWDGGNIKLYAVSAGNGIYTYKDYACKKKAEILKNGACVFGEEIGNDVICLKINGVNRYVYDPDGRKLTEGERMIAWDNPKSSGKIRAEASPKSKKLGYVTAGQSYVVVGEENGYYRIAYDTGGEYENGFAYAPYTSFYEE